MPNIAFTGAYLRMVDIRRDDAGTYAVMHMTANFSKSVCQKMGWEETPVGLTSGKLEGSLNGTNFILTPQKELAKHEIQLDISKASDFQFFSIKNKDGESKRTELRFNVTSIALGSGGIAERYLATIGDGRGTCKITYEKQEELDLQDAPEEGAEEEATPITRGRRAKAEPEAEAAAE